MSKPVKKNIFLILPSAIILAIAIGMVAVSAQNNWQVVFFDDFNNGAQNWNLIPGWVVENEGDGNYVLSGVDHLPFASAGNSLWKDYSLKTQVKLLEGGAHVNFRMQQTPLLSRYFVAVHPGSVSIQKQIGDAFYDLGSAAVPTLTSSTWHTVEVTGEGNLLKVKVDNQEYISRTDQNNPLLIGNIAFETLPGSHVHFDNVEVRGEPIPDPPRWVQTYGPDGGIVRAFTRNPVTGTLFVGAPNAGIFRSVDGGKHWQKSNRGIGDSYFIFHMVVSPDQGKTVYAVFVNGGPFKSMDDGVTWSPINTGLGGQKPFSIAVDPVNPQILYLGTQDGKIFKSLNGGGRWRASSNGLPAGAYSISDLIVSPSNPQTIYASTGWWDDSAGIGIFRSTDGGISWAAVNKGLRGGPTFSTIAIDPRNSNVLFAAGTQNFMGTPVAEQGIYKTADGGSNWRLVLGGGKIDGFGQAVSVAVNPRNPNVVYAGVGKGIFKSTDGGESWKSLEAVPPIPIVTHLMVDENGKVYVTGYYGGVSISNDNGFSWIQSTLGFSATRIYGLGVDPSDPNTVYAGTRGDGQFMTVDGGRTWKRFEMGLEFFGGASWAIDPRDPSIVYSGTYYSYPGRVYKSADAGKNWQKKLDTGQPELFNEQKFTSALVVDPFNSNTILAAVLEKGIYKSTDQGETWRLINTGLSSLLITSLAFDPLQSGTIYAGSFTGGIFKSINGGRTWIAVNQGLTDFNIWSLAIDPSNPAILYAGSGNPEGAAAPGLPTPQSYIGKIFKSMDAGAHWSQVYASPSPGFNIWGLAVDPSDSRVVYAAGDYILMTADGGANWAQGGQLIYDSDNSTQPAVRSLVMDKGGITLYAGTIEGGVFRAELRKSAGVKAIPPLDQFTVAGGVAKHPFYIHNTGNFLDTFDIQARSTLGYKVDVQSTVSLDYGEKKAVSVSVTVPSGASVGLKDTLRLTVTSRFDPNLKAIATNSTIVVGPEPVVSGRVLDANGQPVQGVTVRVRGTSNFTVTDAAGNFRLEGVSGTMSLTAAKEGYYNSEVTGMKGQSNVRFHLNALPTGDNQAYNWLSYRPGWMNPSNCGNCHASIVQQWQTDLHSQSAVNRRFLNVYNGTAAGGVQGVAPGLRLDLPGQQGNCALCHAPLAGVSGNNDMNRLSSIQKESVSCDFCHKIVGVTVKSNGLPDASRPGTQSIKLLRPKETDEVFFGPLDDVPAPDSYLPLQTKSLICAPCHSGSFYNTPIYQSYPEWLASPYARKGIECQSCHMRPSGITNIAPKQGGVRRDPLSLHGHYMPGAADESLLREAVALRTRVRRFGGVLRVEVSLTNSGSGHHVPTDHPMRNMILLVSAQANTGRPLHYAGNQVVPSWGGNYAGRPGKGYAKILADSGTGQTPAISYWNPTTIVSDNRLAAFATDTTSFDFTSPAFCRQIEVKVQVIFRRAFQQLAADKGWDVRDILMAERRIVYTDEDTDGDGLPDGVEDANQNGVVDPNETDPRLSDSDGDRMQDGWEVRYRLNPRSNDASLDQDNDGYINLVEFQRGTDPQDPNSYPKPLDMPWIPLLLLE